MENPGAWVYTVALRRAVRLRRRSDRPIGINSQIVVSDESDSNRRLELLDLENALATLPARQRAVLVLTAIDDLASDEIAKRLGCAASTVRVHLRDGRARLRELLKEERHESK